MPFEPAERFNVAHYFLDARVEEGHGDRAAVTLGEETLSYAQVQSLANRYANALRQLDVRPRERVMIALPDGFEWVGAFFGVLKSGAVVVMVNPGLKEDNLTRLFDYVNPRWVILDGEVAGRFTAAAGEALDPPTLLDVGQGVLAEALETAPEAFENYPTHRDDPAIWLFSGGTTGLPKGVVQSHTSFANTTELYAKGAVGYGPDDVTLSVPKLYFGYATGSNLLFPFAVGARVVLFPEHPTAERLFELIERHRPTILVNVPTMVNQMVSHEAADHSDLSSLRFATSAGEALPIPLYEAWKERFGVELLDGLGTAEMWHIFVTNRPDDVRPGTLGRAVEGFEIDVRDDDGRTVPPGEPGKMWVRGNSRAIGYWRNARRNHEAFHGDWFVGGDLVSRDADGYITYCGRGDDVLKVGGKWLAPQEVESCLLRHEAVRECAVVGVENAEGLTKPVAFVRCTASRDDLPDELKQHVLDRLDAYKHPRQVVVLEEFPRTHLGKVDRGALKSMARESLGD